MTWPEGTCEQSSSPCSKLFPHGFDVVEDRQLDGVHPAGALRVPVGDVLAELDRASVAPRGHRVLAGAHGLLRERLLPHLVDVLDGDDGRDRVPQRGREVGEGVAERHLECHVVDRRDAGQALSRIGLVAAVVAALERRQDVRDVGLVVGVGDPRPGVDEVLRGDGPAHGRLERHARLEVEDPGLRVRGLPRAGDVRLGGQGAVVEHPRRESLKDLMRDLQPGGVLRVERLDGHGVPRQGKRERATGFRRALVADRRGTVPG